MGILRHQPTPLAASRRRVDAARSLTILDNTFVAPMRPISFFAERRASITYIDLWGRVAAVDIELGAQSCLAYVSGAPGDDASDTEGISAAVLCASTRPAPASFRVRILSRACMSQAVFFYRWCMF